MKKVFFTGQHSKRQSIHVELLLTQYLAKPFLNNKFFISNVCHIFFQLLNFWDNGFPFRGHDHDDGAFYNLVFEMARDNQDAIAWLKCRDNYLSDTIQNEIIEMYALEIQRMIIKDAESSAFYGFTADDTTDICGDEQFAVCLTILP